MKIKLAQSSGFCMGVRRAMEQALEAVHHKDGPFFSYGPLIHNPQAVDLLRSKGLIDLAPTPEALAGTSRGVVIIRAHGVPPEEKKALKDMGLEVIDATCPRVIRVQAIIERHSASGFTPIIWGNPDHPEVKGLLGHSRGRGVVVLSVEDVLTLPDLDKVILVAQTTQNQQKFPEMAAAVRSRWPEALIFDTICGATQRRQDDVRRLAREVDAMVIVGGRHSGNTQRLAAAAEDEGVKTVRIETEDELDPEWLAGVKNVGVTAGASTPNWMIKRVIRELERSARRRDVSVRTVSYRLLRILILSNIYAALGAGLLCLAGARLQGAPASPVFFGVVFFYVHAMHVLNLFLDKEASQFSDPDRAKFLERHRGPLLTSGLVSALLALGLGLTLGLKVFIFLLLMSSLGLLYAVPLAPKAWAPKTRFRRLKDVPVSKTLSLSGGWALTLSLTPALAPGGEVGGATVLTAFIIFLLVFIRSALGDIVEIQGDRIVGRETIPIIIGEKKTLGLLWGVLLVLTAALVLGYLSGLLPSLALVLLLCVGYAGLYLLLFKRDQIMSSAFFEALIDANFILAGLLSRLWASLGS
ncbi:MAG: 4-hydroxy-3-methylbut-2-enyl diphosphate reductase [Pseudomonadota bacterium]